LYFLVLFDNHHTYSGVKFNRSMDFVLSSPPFS